MNQKVFYPKSINTCIDRNIKDTGLHASIDLLFYFAPNFTIVRDPLSILTRHKSEKKESCYETVDVLGLSEKKLFDERINRRRRFRR